MTALVKYGLGGAATLLLLSVLVKRKKALPTTLPQPVSKTYMPVKGDRPTAVVARFGTDFNTVFNFNGKKPMLAGRPWMIPPGLSDLGPRPQAMGIVQ